VRTSRDARRKADSLKGRLGSTELGGAHGPGGRCSEMDFGAIGGRAVMLAPSRFGRTFVTAQRYGAVLPLWDRRVSHALPNQIFWEAGICLSSAKCLMTLVGAQGFEPWTR
jgi:hypothetical protein